MYRRLKQMALSPRGRVGLGLSAANYVQAAVGFVVNFYLANRLGAEQYGLLSYGLVLGTVLYTLVNFGAERTLVRDLVQGRDEHAVMTASLILRGSLAVAALIVLVAVVGAADLPRPRRLVVLGCGTAALFWACGPVAWFDAHYQMHRQALIALAEKILYAVLVIAVFSRGLGATAVVPASLLLVTRGLSLATQLAVARRTWKPDTRDLRRHLRWLAAGSAVIVLAALANLLISHWNQLVLEHRLSTARLGYYALAFQMIAVVTLLQNQVVRLFFPRIATLVDAGADPVLAGRKLRHYAAFGWGLSLAVVVPLLLAAPWVVDRFFTTDYRQALAPLRILGVWAVFYGGARLINAFLVNLRLDRQYLWCSLGAGLASVALGLVLVPRYGEVGVAMALLISHPMTTAAQWFFIEQELKRRRLVAAPDTEVRNHES